MVNYITTLYAQGKQLDLFDDEVIKVSNNVTGLFDIDKLPSDFTRQMTIPGSKTNNAFFQHYYNIDVSAPFLFTQDEKVDCYLDVGGFLLVQGYLQLNKVSVVKHEIVSYDITLYGSLSNFSRDLRTTQLTDLQDLSIYNHTSSRENIADSWDGNLFGGDIVYPLVDYGKGISYQQSLQPGQFGIDTPTGLLNIKDFKPAIRTKKVVDTIFSQLGYTYSSSFFNEPMWDNIYTLCDRGKQYPVYDGIDLETYGEFKICQTSGSTTDLVIPETSSVHLNFNTTLEDPSAVIQTPAYFDLPTLTSVNGNIKLNINITGSNEGYSGYPELFLHIADTSGFVSESITLTEINEFLRLEYSDKVGNPPTQGQAQGDKTYTLEQTWTTDTTVLFPKTYKFELYWNRKGNALIDVTIGKGGNTESYIEVTSLRDSADGKIMNIPLNMPFGTNGVTCLDFIKGLQKKYNLVITPSKTIPNHFEIETFNNWYKQGSVVDISQFIDTNKAFDVIPANTLAVNELEFTDEKDVDYLAKLFDEENNRKFGASYYKDDQNQCSEGKLEVKTTFGVSPLRYVQGTGTTSGSPAPPTSYSHSVHYSNLKSYVCSPTGFSNTVYTINSTLQLNDVVYTDSGLTTPLTSQQYIREVSTSRIFVLNTSTGRIITETTCP